MVVGHSKRGSRQAEQDSWGKGGHERESLEADVSIRIYLTPVRARRCVACLASHFVTWVQGIGCCVCCGLFRRAASLLACVT